jgi:hypothetical protein
MFGLLNFVATFSWWSGRDSAEKLGGPKGREVAY